MSVFGDATISIENHRLKRVMRTHVCDDEKAQAALPSRADLVDEGES